MTVNRFSLKTKTTLAALCELIRNRFVYFSLRSEMPKRAQVAPHGVYTKRLLNSASKTGSAAW